MIQKFNIDMKELNRTREITVYLPDDYYSSHDRYPVLYIQDGQNAFFDQLSFMGKSWGFLNYVKETGIKIIMVAIPCNFEGFKRMDEYGPWPISKELSLQETQTEGVIIGGEGKLYVEWMINELKPYIDKRYRTMPNNTAITGSSMGGVISAYATLAYPHVFSKCAALSTAFWFYMDEFKELIESHDYDDVKLFYFDLGQFEGCGSEMIDDWYFESNDEIFELIQDKIENIEYYYAHGAYHNEMEWNKRVPLFMGLLYGKYYGV